IATLVPGYEAGQTLDLPQAKLGEPAANAPVPAPAADRPDYRRWSLWAVLVLAVAVLAAMAYRLLRQMRAATGDAGPSGTDDTQEARRNCLASWAQARRSAKPVMPRAWNGVCGNAAGAPDRCPPPDDSLRNIGAPDDGPAHRSEAREAASDAAARNRIA